MKKNILFNLICTQPSYGNKFHGGGEYTKKILLHILENYNNRCNVIVFYDFGLFLDQWLLDLFLKYNIKKYDVKDTKDIIRIFETEKIDTYYSGIVGNESRWGIPQNIKKIGTLHGLREYEMPIDKYFVVYSHGLIKIKQIIKFFCVNYFRKREMIKAQNQLKFFDEIVCVSNHSYYAIALITQAEILKKVHMFYTPSKIYMEASPDIVAEIKHKYSDFILMIGGNRWMKNPYRTLDALLRMDESGHLNLNVVIVGELDKKAKKRFLKKTNKFINLDYVNNDILEALYSSCKVFLYTTLNEGFGMPPLEAMRYGKTCVVSAVTSLPELYEGVTYMVNPYDVLEIENRILQAIDKPISSQVVKQRFEEIVEKQDVALDGVCNLIVS